MRSARIALGAVKRGDEPEERDNDDGRDHMLGGSECARCGQRFRQTCDAIRFGPRLVGGVNKVDAVDAEKPEDSAQIGLCEIHRRSRLAWTKIAAAAHEDFHAAAAEQPLVAAGIHRFSSLPKYSAKKRPDWLISDVILGSAGDPSDKKDK